MSGEALKPCPNCGSGKVADNQLVTSCKDCGSAALRGHWNSRPAENALRAENERLRDLIRRAMNAASHALDTALVFEITAALAPAGGKEGE